MITLGQFLPVIDPETKIAIVKEDGFPVPLTKGDISASIPRGFEEMDASYIIPLLDLNIKSVSHCSGFIRITIHVACI